MPPKSNKETVKKTKEEKRLEREEKERKQEILIAKYEQNPFLYDKENPKYKDGKEKTAVIQDIAKLLECKYRVLNNSFIFVFTSVYARLYCNFRL